MLNFGFISAPNLIFLAVIVERVALLRPEYSGPLAFNDKFRALFRPLVAPYVHGQIGVCLGLRGIYPTVAVEAVTDVQAAVVHELHLVAGVVLVAVVHEGMPADEGFVAGRVVVGELGPSLDPALKAAEHHVARGTPSSRRINGRSHASTCRRPPPCRGPG